MEDKLQPLVLERGFNSFLDYYYLLKYDVANEGAWQQLIEVLRVPETFFWRESDQLQALTQVIIPTYFAEYGTTRPLRIWSAACSSGEEPLSIALALQEAGWFDRLNIKIVASDICATALKKAQQGLFRHYAVHKLPLPLRDKYFLPQADLWQIKPSVLSRVRWTTANLTVKTEVEHLARSEIIFCRNVFIYFSETSIRQILHYFFTAMPTPSFLFVSISESLLKFATDFQLQEFGKVFVYVKQR